MCDIFFGHFVDKMERGILSGKDTAVAKCLFDKLSQMDIEDLKTADKDYHQKLVRQINDVLKKDDVGQIETNDEVLPIKVSSKCANTILSVESLEQIYG